MKFNFNRMVYLMKKTGSLLIFLLALTVFSGCSGGGSDDKAQVTPPEDHYPDLSDLAPYLPAGPYAELLKRCVSARENEEACTLSELPFIGQDFETPTTDDIMGRLVVSHEWMGDNFMDMLGSYLHPDIKMMLKGVTAIVIDADIKPSFYNTVTGAIYINPDYLWTTDLEKADIPDKTDYRASYGDDLNFLKLSRYIKDNDYAAPGFYSSPRTMSDLIYPLSALLYHELAHANDFIPPSQIPLLTSTMTVLEAINSHDAEGLMISNLLQTDHPLESITLKDLAAVKYRGETATEAQKVITAGEVGSSFETEGANDLYSYSNMYEDTAMLFEETMLKYHYDVDRDIAFTVIPADDRYCFFYVVKWGVRNRIADPLVEVRARYAATLLLPGVDFDTFFSNLSTSTKMTADKSWCDNLDLLAMSKPSLEGSDFSVPLEQLISDASIRH